jgi:hypothetical protein
MRWRRSGDTAEDDRPSAIRNPRPGGAATAQTDALTADVLAGQRTPPPTRRTPFSGGPRAERSSDVGMPSVAGGSTNDRSLVSSTAAVPHPTLTRGW